MPAPFGAGAAFFQVQSAGPVDTYRAVSVLDDILSDIPDSREAVRDVRVCLRVTAVLLGRLGLAYTFPRSGPAHPESHTAAPRRLMEHSASELATLAQSSELDLASVGVAAMNALIAPPDHLRDGQAFDVIVEYGRGKHVALVGRFPFVDRLRAQVAKLSVLELNPLPGDLPAEMAAATIPDADVLAVTASTLVNHTLDGLLALARGKPIILIGPTAPLTNILFAHGVSAICGSVVVDPDAALRSASDGEGFRSMRGLRRVVMRE